jgi:hypothetical protein
MVNPVILQAQRGDFSCHKSEQGEWVILPNSEEQDWQLSQQQERWILSVQSVPQISLDDADAINFLRLRRQQLDPLV